MLWSAAQDFFLAQAKKFEAWISEVARHGEPPALKMAEFIDSVDEKVRSPEIQVPLVCDTRPADVGAAVPGGKPRRPSCPGRCVRRAGLRRCRSSWATKLRTSRP